MKTLVLSAWLSLCYLSLTAQDAGDETTGRKGQWLIETGTSLVNSFSTSATGGGILFSDGSTFTNLGINAGKFTSDNFAVKFNLGIISFGSGFGTNSTLYTIGGGGKYYISGMAPIEIAAGAVTGAGTSFIGRATIGYAAALAENINFEPAAGILINEDSTVGLLQFSFVMFF